MADNKNTNNKVKVWYIPKHISYMNIPTLCYVGCLSRARADKLVKLIQKGPGNANSCIAEMSADYRSTGYRGARADGRNIDLTTMALYDTKCGLCDAGAYSCLHNMRRGKCKDAFMRKIGVLLFPTKYVKER